MKPNPLNVIRVVFRKIYQKKTHSEMIKRLLEEHLKSNTEKPIFIETGSGLSTMILSELGRSVNAIIFSCDNNSEKIYRLKRSTKKQFENVEFLIGDSLESLYKITRKHDHIHFVFFDSAPSAIHTFREFQIVESCLKDGSTILIDNAALPNAKLLLSPCRKGKIVVPYLLASPNWNVSAHPNSGDSMISATYRYDSNYTDPSYELVDYVDPWISSFKNKLF